MNKKINMGLLLKIFFELNYVLKINLCRFCCDFELIISVIFIIMYYIYFIE